MHLAIGADGDGIAHRLQEGLAAVRIGIACRIICVRADVDIDLILLKEARRERCRRREHESVAERHIGRDLALPVLGDLLRVALVGDLFCGACEEGAVRILENGRKIKFVVPYMVVLCDLACRKDLFLVFLPIKIEAVTTFSAPSLSTASETQVVESTPPLERIIAFFILPPVFYSWCSDDN